MSLLLTIAWGLSGVQGQEVSAGAQGAETDKTPLQKYLRRDLRWRGHEYDTVLKGRVTNFFGVASREDIEYVFESRKQYATTGNPECAVSGGSNYSRDTAPAKTPENAWQSIRWRSGISRIFWTTAGRIVRCAGRFRRREGRLFRK